MDDKSHRPHVLVFAYPAQGHINPMLQFAKRLASKGISVSLVTTVFVTKSMEAHMGPINVESISDGFDEGGRESAASAVIYLEKFRSVGMQSLLNLIQRLNASDCPANCLVYDSFITWALDVAKQCGLLAASFLTQSCAVDLIYYNVFEGRLSAPPIDKTVSLPGLPQLESSELPSFVATPDRIPGVLQLVVKQFSNMDQADWVLCNSFHELEAHELSWMKEFWHVKAIGPTVPSMYLDNRVEGDRDYGLSLWKKEEAVCKKWLQDKEAGSVVYVSFGSLAKLGVEQMEEIACALIGSNHHFLWVVRASEEAKLPEGFLEEATTRKGLIVRWAPQLEVLAHEAVGCFVTHCGWNSTLEGLSLGVPMVGFPQWSDQPTNAKYIEEVWGVGIRAGVDEKGLWGREEMKKCIEEVMEGERRGEMLRNAMKWRELAVHALDEGGSSDKDIEEFVAAFTK